MTTIPESPAAPTPRVRLIVSIPIEIDARLSERIDPRAGSDEYGDILSTLIREAVDVVLGRNLCGAQLHGHVTENPVFVRQRR